MTNYKLSLLTLFLMLLIPVCTVSAEQLSDASLMSNTMKSVKLRYDIENCRSAVLAPDTCSSVVIDDSTKMSIISKDALVAHPGDPQNTHEHPYYNWKRDITYAGLPIIAASFLIKSQKKAFRSVRMSSLGKGWHSEWDNYTQFSPYAVILGLKAFGYEGRSNWGRFLASTAAANIIMAGIANGMKYSIKEMRPDNSSANSFPSGHTATAFVAATILHKEYGLTRSPWFSVGGYAVATATGVMRVMNNRHWISDVMAGAGIGIMSTELGYWLVDRIFKEKGIKRYELEDLEDSERPSFFDIQMGVGLHSKSIDFGGEDKIELGTSTAFGVEGAYFLNKHWGVGGMLRITTTPTKNADFSDEERSDMNEINDAMTELGLPTTNFTLKDNNFIDTSLDFGVYYNLPLSNRFAIGAKALLGVRFADGIRYTAQEGERKDPVNGMYWFLDEEGNEFLGNQSLSHQYNYALKPESRTAEYDCLKVNGSTDFSYVLGVSFTYRYKNNFSWKVFCDFDSSRNKYTYVSQVYTEDTYQKYQTLLDVAKEMATDPAEKASIQETKDAVQAIHTPASETTRKWMNFFTVGGAFTVNF